MSWSETLRFDQVAEGAELPPLDIPLTVTGIVATAMATRDFQNVHHDLEQTRQLGSPHIFMNILTSNAMVERYVSEWAGPAALLKSVKIKLGAPNYPGDTMVMSGAVIGRDSASRCLTLDIKGRNSLGSHLTGTVELVLP